MNRLTSANIEANWRRIVVLEERQVEPVSILGATRHLYANALASRTLMRLDDIGIAGEEIHLAEVLPDRRLTVKRGARIGRAHQRAEVGDAPRVLEGEPALAQLVGGGEQEHQAARAALPPRRDVEVEDCADLPGVHARLVRRAPDHRVRPRRVHLHQRPRHRELAAQVRGAAAGRWDGRWRRRVGRAAVGPPAVPAVVAVAAPVARLRRRAFGRGRRRWRC